MAHNILRSKRKWILSILVCFLSTAPAWAQKAIKGVIEDATTKKPIDGVSIFNKNNEAATYSMGGGLFSIKASKGDTLKFSFIGYGQGTYVVGDQDRINISLNPTSQNLNDVVVTALGVRKKADKIGYSVQEVNGADLTKARDQNPITGLAGKVAGLSVGPSAELLRSPTVLLRGDNITLYVVDGIPINSDTWNISPDDIASYTVLKGPAAAALYGSRAINGAILITTKKGLEHKKGFTVEINSSNEFQKGFLAFPRLQDEYGPGENEIYSFGDGKGGGVNDNDYDIWGPKFEGQLISQYDSPVDPATGKRTPTPWLARGKDNLKRFLRTGFQTTDNVALTASGDKYNLRFSMSQSSIKSIIPNMGLNISNFNMYGSYQISKKLKIEANVNYNKQYSPNFPDVDYGPNSLIYDVAVWTGADWNIADMKNYWQPGKVGTQQLFEEYQRYHNPYFMVYEWLRGHDKTDVYGYTSLNYKFNDHLNLTGRTQVTTYSLLRTEKMPFSAHPYGREQGLGDYREDRRNLFENNTEMMLNYNYDVGNFVNLSGLFGSNLRTFEYNSNYTSTDYLNVPNDYSFSNSRNPLLSSSFNSQMRVLSGYYSLDASFGRYATLSTTGRVDKSSALPTEHNAYFYPSASLASVVSDYVNMPKIISYLKLRGSVADVRGGGTTPYIGQNITFSYGNDYSSPYGGPDYSLIPAYSISKPYNNQPATSYTNNLTQSGIKPFNRVSYEEGFDIRFLHNRIGLNATTFQYIDGPLILQNPVSTATGYDYEYINALKTKKTGYELTLTATPIKNLGGITWNLLANWSTFVDKYIALPPGQTTYNTFFKVGDRVDKFYGSAFVRTKDGKIINDAAGKPLVNPVLQYLGNLNPDFSWSVYNSVSWKGFTLGFQFDGSVGGVTTDYMHNKTMRGGRNIETVQGAFGDARYQDFLHATDTSYKGTYVGEGVVVSNGTPINYDSKTGDILNYNDLQFVKNSQTAKVQDYISKYYATDESNLMSKTYCKLREVTITYNIPDKILRHTFIEKASFSLVGRNLLYFYKDKRFKDIDVDQFNYSTTSTGLQSPTTRSYGFNVNVVF